MGYAQVLSTASKAGTAGGTFADALAANTGDSLAVANYDTGGARILEAWGIDSTSVAEVQFIYSRPDATHDQSGGLKFAIPALTPGGAGTVAAVDLLPGFATVQVYKSDTPVINVTSTAGDNVLVSWITEYDNLPGAEAQFTSPATVQAMRKSTVGIRVAAVASATRGAYGATRAFNVDDDRLHGNTYYAILGCSVRTPVTTVSLIGPEWGGQRIGLPAGVSHLNPVSWFIDQSVKWNKPLIPFFNSANKANILVQVADGQANTSAQIDFLLYELTGRPG